MEVLEGNMGDINSKDKTLFDVFYETKWQSKNETIILEVSWNHAFLISSCFNRNSKLIEFHCFHLSKHILVEGLEHTYPLSIV